MRLEKNMGADTDRFEKYAAEWWNPTGRLFSLHRINPLRFEYFKEKAGELKDRRVLDIGCGGGLLAERFASSGAFVTGIDLSPVAIEAAKKHSAENGLEIDYKTASPAILVKEDHEPFDIVICAEVLEHVDDLAGFLKDSLSMLKPRGTFFFGTINKTIKARFFALFIAEDVLKMVPKGTHDYKRFIRPSLLKEILEANSTEMTEIKGMTYDPLRLEFRISEDTSVNYLGYAVKK